MARQSTSLMDTFEIDNEVLTINFVQKQIDYDYSINKNAGNFVGNACLETNNEFQ